jgi:hypothetical protein
MTQYPNIVLRKCVTENAKPDWFEVVEDCCCAMDLTIPAGYVTDFASVPRLLWPLFPPHGRMANASVKHDYRYDNKIGEAEYGSKRARYMTDTDFFFDMQRDGVPRWQAHLMYLIVRLFGKSWWEK